MKKISASQIKTSLGGGFLLLMAAFLIFSSYRAESVRRCSGVYIDLKGGEQIKMIDKEAVLSKITLGGTDLLDGKLLADIDLKELKSRISKIESIHSGKVYIDLNGALRVDLNVRKPVARILRGSSDFDRYIDENGVMFPASGLFTPTVLLMSGPYFNGKTTLDSDENSDLVLFVNQIVKDDFWSSLITHIEVGRNMEMVLSPLFGNNKIEFGKPENVENKLQRLLVYYENILPEKEWSDFERVIVKYDGQIVCK